MPLRATILRLSPPLVFRLIVHNTVNFPFECDSLEYYFAPLFLFFFLFLGGGGVGGAVLVCFNSFTAFVYLFVYALIYSVSCSYFRKNLFFVFHFSIVLLYFSLKLLIYLISLFPIVILIESKCSLA